MTDSSEATVEAVAPEAPSSTARGRTILMDPGNIWRISLVLIAAFALARFLWFILDDGGTATATIRLRRRPRGRRTYASLRWTSSKNRKSEINVCEVTKSNRLANLTQAWAAAMRLSSCRV